MTEDNHLLNENLKRMFRSAFDPPNPGFQERLVRDVLGEVARQRRNETSQTWWQGLLSARLWWRPLPLAASAVVVLIALAIWVTVATSIGTVGEVSCLYGFVAVQDHGRSRTVSEAASLKSGQWVKTASGSKAQILLRDQSKLVPDPRTRLQVSSTPKGPRILLERGTMSVEAASQPPGQAMTIEASRASVKVLGTKLDVRVTERPSGHHQARVRVLKGRVELESGGQKVLLLAGTEGVADEGQPPVRASVVPEVNELIRLVDQTRTLAESAGRAAGSPAIIDLTTSTLWAVVPAADFDVTTPGLWSLRLKYPAFRVRAYTLEGAEIPAEGSGEVLRLSLSPTLGAALPEHLILKVPGVGGLITPANNGLLECIFPAGDADRLSLIQLHLPGWVQLEHVSPAAIETSRQTDKLILTVAANIQLPQIHY